jgi:preprotein translocase subunit SecA
MDYLREGIQLRAYGQRDPLLEYKQEAHKMFFEMEGRVRRQTIENLFRIQVAKKGEGKGVFLSTEQHLIHNERSALAEGKKTKRAVPEITPAALQGDRNLPMEEERKEAKGAPRAPFKRKTPKVGRNDPCPCGSGKKYKKCCGK